MQQKFRTKKEAYQHALQQQYRAILCDIDGTLSPFGSELIDPEIFGAIENVAKTATIGVCTGRNFEHAMEKIMPLVKGLKNPQKFFKNWIFVCENGSAGYAYDHAEENFLEFYRVSHPLNPKEKQQIFDELCKTMGDLLEISRMNDTSFIFVPNTTNEDVLLRQRESDLMAQILEKKLLELALDDILMVADSGLGCTVIPKNGNKDRGVHEVAKYLREVRGLQISNNAKEIVAIGDQPEPLGNDETFLNGKIGTPFSVGNTLLDNIFPLPVFDLKGRIMGGPKATKHLLENLKLL